MKELLKAKAQELGFDQLGVAAAQTPPHYKAYLDWINGGNHADMEYLANHAQPKQHPSELLPECKSVIVVSMNYNPGANPKRTVARYAHGRDYHKVLTKKLKELSTLIIEHFPEARNRVCVDAQPLMERDFAQLAGIGWFGKNTLIINSKRGSWFVLGCLLTTLELEPDPPAIGGCGTCTACIEACPTGAIKPKGDHWEVDSRLCISAQTIERKSDPDVDTAGWVFGCDICQEVCPFNQPNPKQPLRAAPTQVPEFMQQNPIANMSAQEISELSYEDWNSLTISSPIRRSKYLRLRLIALNQANKEKL